MNEKSVSGMLLRDFHHCRSFLTVMLLMPLSFAFPLFISRENAGVGGNKTVSVEIRQILLQPPLTPASVCCWTVTSCVWIRWLVCKCYCLGTEMDSLHKEILNIVVKWFVVSIYFTAVTMRTCKLRISLHTTCASDNKVHKWGSCRKRACVKVM